MAGPVYCAATGRAALDERLRAAFEAAELERNRDSDTASLRALLPVRARVLRVQPAPGKGSGVFVREGLSVAHGTLVGVYMATVGIRAASAGEYQMQCVDWPRFAWPGGRRTELWLDGAVRACGVAFDGRASRFNHTCGRPTVMGRWRTFGKIKVLEFRANARGGCFEGGTELVYDYNGGKGTVYAVGPSQAATMEAAGVAMVPCRCNGFATCPRNRYVPEAGREM